MKRYRVKYRVEVGDWPKPSGGIVVREGIRVSDTDDGYADDVFVASFVEGSVLLLPSTLGQAQERANLLAVRDQIDHYLTHHLGEAP